VFNDAAEIEVRVGATGIDALKGVAAQKMSDPTAAEDTRYGTLVAPERSSPSTTITISISASTSIIDSSSQQLQHRRLRARDTAGDSPRRSLYVVKADDPNERKAARVDTGHARPSIVVVNEARTNGVGNPVSYELLYREPRRRCAGFPRIGRRSGPNFLQHRLWVTPYDPAERYAGGDYMFSNSATAATGLDGSGPADPKPGHRLVGQSSACII
jgi:primary-amine oxidase